jgi:hypothetical protein
MQKIGSPSLTTAPRLGKLPIFRQRDIRMALKSTNTIHKKTRRKTHHTTQEYEKSGIYQQTNKTYQKAYVGHTSNKDP